MPHRLRSAVIGVGFVGPFHVDAIRRGGYADVVTLVGTDAETVGQKATALGVPYWTTDVASVLGDGSLDVIHICTPNASHTELGLAALSAGRHVVMEKPLALDPEGAAELLSAARRAGRHAAVSFTYRGYPMVAEARALVASGQVGDVRLVHGGYLQDWLSEAGDWNWRVDAAQGSSRAVADIGSHWFDLLEYVSGLRVKAVFADLATFLPARRRAAKPASTFSTSSDATETVRVETEDAAVLAFRLEGGARATCLISQVSPGRNNALSFELGGSRSSIAWDQETPERLWVGRRDEAARILIRRPSTSGGRPGTPPLPAGHPEGWSEALRDMLRPFYAAIAAGDPPPSNSTATYPSFSDGARAVAFVAAALESSQSSSWVELIAAEVADRAPRSPGSRT
jgi:predicted dehydrogenase